MLGVSKCHETCTRHFSQCHGQRPAGTVTWPCGSETGDGSSYLSSYYYPSNRILAFSQIVPSTKTSRGNNVCSNSSFELNKPKVLDDWIRKQHEQTCFCLRYRHIFTADGLVSGGVCCLYPGADWLSSSVSQNVGRGQSTTTQTCPPWWKATSSTGRSEDNETKLHNKIMYLIVSNSSRLPKKNSLHKSTSCWVVIK